jgi:succinate dehydrogenase/fumarate reductase flavoprotein subunit
VDITKEMLEIALCSQHNNGGLDIDMWWQTNVPHLFAAGEVAGSHGVYRPGGSALNAGQAGSMRAAQYIARHGGYSALSEAEFAQAATDTLRYHEGLVSALLADHDTVTEMTRCATARMTECGGALRNPEAIRDALARTAEDFASFAGLARITSPAGLFRAYRLRDALISQQMYLSAMLDYAEQGGKSRGSALYTDPAGQCPDGFDDTFRFRLDDGKLDTAVQTVTFTKEGCIPAWREVRPLPEGGGFFENVWREYRENGNVY